ncbi:hypothetical protein, partial [Amycolatopsis kentuckyensis]|uniref:hypothetical protein n=1 Tax=Amycolatopsis kentuckyensis TaxID=218823 RepID=UPI001177AA5E
MSPERPTTAVTGHGQPETTQQLHAAATACENAAAGERFTGDREVLVWARARLAEVAAVCRELAAALGIDPTLAAEPTSSPQLRAAEVVVELARQLQWLLRAAAIPPGSGGRAAQPDYLAERRADALTTRLLQLAAGAAQVLPRADAHTETGARDIFRHRLAGNS